MVEANVAISIANYGGEVDYVTRLPENALGENCITELRSHNGGRKTSCWAGSDWALITWRKPWPCAARR